VRLSLKSGAKADIRKPPLRANKRHRVYIFFLLGHSLGRNRRMHRHDEVISGDTPTRTISRTKLKLSFS
jgi:hypothetical protein